MKLLITGYSGFVGGFLTHSLAELGTYEINLLGRKSSSLGEVFHHNLDADSDYSEALDGVETVVHCAARVHVMQDKALDPLAEFRAVNTQGTLNLARQAAQLGVKRFVFVSSIKVNGESTTDKPAFCAGDKPMPEDPYGLSKAEAEAQLLRLGQETGMDIVIIRPPLVYGQGVKANFASLMRFVAKGLPLPFRAIRNNRRSLVSVYNLVDLIKVCLIHPHAANKTFLVSDDQDLSTAEMVALMARVQNKKNIAIPVPVFLFRIAAAVLKKQEIVDRLTGSLQLDITETKNTLDWTPPYSVEDGFKLAAKK
ncbi:hypothetical protein N473_05775 [Pseudoalteromonas luteoviolacea CPMOR-1]|uniref:NAD-dependent epimerase/dehydratase domain-containing protein n=1 Tax=Pseudoalteromonas luteoviolacea CPMOR-1 TaxID=1365248 RepID=A0A167HKZ4_9GAMM|nr:SDR family oxidoreductase [Pseudoalteromonas luteoviolacea]KZN58250.1 hypothetical protein N473_05775 [Pseudoalteromonas luteoviolacea CPMOR-1]